MRRSKNEGRKVRKRKTPNSSGYNADKAVDEAAQRLAEIFMAQTEEAKRKK